jgi:Domain of unknown function (DUF397)
MKSGLNWIKASSSVGTGACVELARDGDMIALRDSKNPETAPFRYTDREMSAFLAGAKAGEFDHLLHPLANADLERTAGPGS